MTTLTFNPLTELLLMRIAGEVVAVKAAAPVRGRPLRITTLSRTNDREIFDVLCGIAAGRAVDTKLDDGTWAQLVEAGIPKDHIVLAFHPPNKRPFTSFATD